MIKSKINSTNNNKSLKFIDFIIVITFTLIYAYTDHLYFGIAAILLALPLIIDLSFSLPVLLLFSFLDFDLQFMFGQYMSTIYMIIICIFALLNLLRKDKIYISPNDIIVLVIILSVLITTLLSNTFDNYEYKNVILILFTYLLITKSNNIDIKQMHKCTIFVVFCIALYLIIYNIINPWDISQSRYRYSEYTNVNTIAKLVSQIYSIFLIVILLYKDPLKRIGCLLVICYLTYMIIALSSRTAVLGLIIGGMTSFYLLLKNNKGMRLRNMLLIAISLLCVYFVVSITSFNDDILYRFTIEEIITSKGSDRILIWGNLIKGVIPNNIFFGIGFSPNSMKMALIRYGSSKISGYGHNILLDMLAQGGIVFTVLLIKIFISGIKGVTKQSNIKEALLFTAPIITTLFIGIGENVFMDKVMWVFLMMLCIYLKNINSHIIKE